jgi:hypothetical protein
MPSSAKIRSRALALSIALTLVSCIDRDPTTTGMPAIKTVAPPTLVKAKLFNSVDEIAGIRWPRTADQPDSSAAFKGPCDFQIDLDESHSCKTRVVAGMLGQDNGKLSYARLYFTAHPVGLDEALTLVAELAVQFGVSTTAEYKDYRQKLATQRVVSQLLWKRRPLARLISSM